MSEEEAMDTLDTPWFWYYLADCGRWHRFEVSCLQLWNFFFFFLITSQSKRCRKRSKRFVSTRQEDPNNPIRSEDVENYFQRNPAGILKASLTGCQSKIDFKGNMYFALFLILFSPGIWLHTDYSLCALYTEMLQTDVSTGRQRRVRRDCNIERRWNRFKALQHKPDLCRAELRQRFGLVSRKAKLKLNSV